MKKGEHMPEETKRKIGEANHKPKYFKRLMAIALLFLVMIMGANAAIPELAWYKVDQQYLDSSPNANTLVPNGPPIFNATNFTQGNASIQFSGSPYASIATPAGLPTGDTPIAITFWVREVGTGANTRPIYFGGPGDGGQLLCYEPDSSNFKCSFDGTNTLLGATPISGWSFYVFQYEGGNHGRLYQNNNLVSQVTSVATINFNWGNGISLGSNWGGGNAWTGGLDDIRLFNLNLTEANRTFLYNGGKAQENSLGASGGGGPVVTNLTALNSTPLNNTQYALNLINFSVLFNNSAKNPAICNLSIDGVFNESKSNTSSISTNIFLTQWNNVYVAQGTGTHNSSIICSNNEATGTFTVNNLWYNDVVLPTITTTIVNNTLIYGGNLTNLMTFQDDVILSSYNVSLNGVLINSNNTLSTNYTNVSINKALNLGKNYLNVRVADGHTTSSLMETYTTTKDTNILQITSKNQQTKIYEKSQNSLDKWSTSQQKDRLTFDYIPKDATKSTYTMVIETPEEARIITAPNTKYKQWIIYGNHWVDFMMENDNPTLIFRQITSRKIEVDISNIKNPSEMQFNSIGELNIVNAAYDIYLINSSTIYNATTVETANEQYVLNLTSVPSGTTTNAVLNFNGTNYLATKTSYSGFDTFVANVNLPLFNQNTRLAKGIWNFTANGLSSLVEFNQTIVKMYISNCSDGIGGNVINWTIKDDVTDAEVVSNVTAQFTVWYGNLTLSRVYQLSWYNNATPQVCMLPNVTLKTSYDLITYASGSYAQKHKNIIAGVLTKIPTLVETLYLTSGASSVVINLVNEVSNPLGGYLLEMYKKNVVTGNYTFEQSEITDINGNAPFYYLTATSYKFWVYNTSGIKIYDTGDMYIVSNPTTIRIATKSGTDIGGNNLAAWTLRTTLYNVSKHIYLNWTTLAGTSGTICLNVTKSNLTSMIQLYGACSSADYGSLDYNVLNSDGRIVAIAWIKGSTYVTNTLEMVIDVTNQLWQEIGADSMIIYMILLVIAIAVSITNVQTLPYSLIAVHIVAYMLGILPITYGFLVVLICGFVLVAARVRD